MLLLKFTFHVQTFFQRRHHHYYVKFSDQAKLLKTFLCNQFFLFAIQVPTIHNTCIIINKHFFFCSFWHSFNIQKKYFNIFLLHLIVQCVRVINIKKLKFPKIVTFQNVLSKEMLLSCRYYFDHFTIHRKCSASADNNP